MELTRAQIIDLLNAFLDGFLQGTAVQRLNIKVNQDTDFESLTNPLLSEQKRLELNTLFTNPGFGNSAVQQLDALVDESEVLVPASEILFDLMMLKMILDAGEEKGEDFLESPEWEKMEDSFIERGTELLNLMIYLRDCRDNELPPRLEDFLDEFLLVNDEQFQDEFFIYEPLIRNQHLIGESDEAIMEVAKGIDSPPLEDLFSAILLFFRHLGNSSGPVKSRILNQAHNPGVTAGTFLLLKHFFILSGQGAN